MQNSTTNFITHGHPWAQLVWTYFIEHPDYNEGTSDDEMVERHSSDYSIDIEKTDSDNSSDTDASSCFSTDSEINEYIHMIENDELHRMKTDPEYFMTDSCEFCIFPCGSENIWKDYISKNKKIKQNEISGELSLALENCKKLSG